MRSLDEINTDLSQLGREKADALTANGWRVAYTDMEKLVDLYHSKTCRYNHTDGCGWMYEVADINGQRYHDWNGRTHADIWSTIERKLGEDPVTIMADLLMQVK